MITVKKATKKDKEKVYEWICRSNEEEKKRYRSTNLTIFFEPFAKTNQEMIYETLENPRYENRYFYFFAYEEKMIVGIMSFVHIKKETRNDIRMIDFYSSKNKLEIYDAFLETLEAQANQLGSTIIKMRYVYPSEKQFQKSLENHHFELRKVTLTDEDLKVEKKLKPLGYRIAFLGKNEIKEAQAYYDTIKQREFINLDVREYFKSKSSRVLLARKNKKIVGLLFGSIVSPYYTVSYLDICVGENETIQHDLLNEFKRICLKEESDDILVETTSQALQQFVQKEHFKENRRSYFKRLKKEQ